MKKNVFLITTLVLLSACLSAQKDKTYTVAAGLKVEDCIPFEERYCFPEFTVGKVIFKSGTNTEAKLNYNYLIREMQYLQGRDTLAIANEADILQVVIGGEIFIMNKGFMQVIYNGKVSVALKQYLKQMEVIKKDSYGSAGSNSATDSYNSIQTDGQTYKLILNHDRIFKKIAEYYLEASSGVFVPFTKKKVLQLFPQKKKDIEAYLKSNKVDFNSREDLIRFAEYLSEL